MPELPEVQTVVNDLQAKLAGQIVASAVVKSPKQVTPAPKAFARLLAGRKIVSITRRAKVIVFHLDKDLIMVGHMKMTGQFVYRSKAGRLAGGGHPFDSLRSLRAGPFGVADLGLPNRYTQVQFGFKSGDSLYFNDTRKFGYVRVYSTANWQKMNDSDWGVDPFDKRFTAALLQSWAKRRPKITIKQLIMDQSLLAGVGNIYADESLFRARISPKRRAQTIKAVEANKLVSTIKTILKLAVAKRGTTVNDYRDGHGNRGTYARYLRVYGRGGKPCTRCSRPLSRTVVGGRGTVFCSNCQQ
jgi:formamidopyrimidine-DNA glycosylase